MSSDNLIAERIKTEKPVEIELNAITHPFFKSTKDIRWDYTFSVNEMKIILEKNNKNNRPRNKARIKTLEEAIKNNQWMPNTANLITFDCNGDLISGAHRFVAHINQNRSFTADVMYGLQPEVRLHTDDAWGRSAAVLTLTANGEELTKENHARKTKEFAMVKLLLRAENKFTTIPAPSPQKLQELVLSRKENISRVLDFVNPFTTRVSVRVACLQYLEKDPEKGLEFLNGMFGQGEQLAADSPILITRNYIIKQKYSGGSAIAEEYKVVVYSIHKHYKGEPMTKIGRMIEWEF